jgi:hypothetical protein
LIFENGYLNGPYTEYHSKSGGKVKRTGFYTGESKRTGKWVEYHLNGKKLSEGNYYPDFYYVQADSARKFILIMDGQDNERSRLPFSKENLDSLSKKYEESEISEMVFPSRVDVKDGVWKYWDENGTLLREEFWDKGLLIRAVKQ